jgi:hypothetical protein
MFIRRLRENYYLIMFESKASEQALMEVANILLMQVR